MYARLTQDPVRQAIINAQTAMATPSRILPGEGQIEVLKHHSNSRLDAGLASAKLVAWKPGKV